MDRGYDGLKILEHCNRIENLSYLIHIRSGMTKKIKSLPDKELDMNLKFEVMEQSKRHPYKMKIQAWDMNFPCTVSFRLVKLKLNDKWLVMATNLPRSEFSVRTFKSLSEKRWKIELSFSKRQPTLSKKLSLFFLSPLTIALLKLIPLPIMGTNK